MVQFSNCGHKLMNTWDKIYVYFWQCQELNPGPHACKESVLLLNRIPDQDLDPDLSNTKAFEMVQLINFSALIFWIKLNEFDLNCF